MSKRFLEDEGRYNYTTPKSFLELIDFYKELLRKKQGELDGNINRLATGLETLKKTNGDVQVSESFSTVGKTLRTKDKVPTCFRVCRGLHGFGCVFLYRNS